MLSVGLKHIVNEVFASKSHVIEDDSKMIEISVIFRFLLILLLIKNAIFRGNYIVRRKLLPFSEVLL